MNRRKILVVLATVFLLLGVLVVRATWEGYDALERGDQAHEAGDPEGAVRWWRRAARWYVPMAPHVDTAYKRLHKLAVAAEDKGDHKLAVAAWTGIRSSIRATRSFYSPYEEYADEADTHIASLMAAEEARMNPEKDRVEREAWHYALLKLDQMPSTFWSIFALFGLALWIGGGFAFAWRAVDDSDRLVPKAAAYSGSAIALGLVVWLIGLYYA